MNFSTRLILVTILFLANALVGNIGCTPQQNSFENVVSLPLTEPITSLDPHVSTNETSTWITHQIFETLFTFEGQKKSPEPLLVETYDISKDGLSYSLKIKKGVYFHSHPSFDPTKKRELTPEDVIYSLKRAVDPILHPQMENRSLPPLVGLTAWREGRKKGQTNLMTAIEGIHLDPETKAVILQLEHSDFRIKYWLAQPLTAVVPMDLLEQASYSIAKNPIGTGAWRILEWKKSSKVALAKKEETKPLVIFSEVASADARALNFLKGNFDFIKEIQPQDLAHSTLGLSEKDLKIPDAQKVKLVMPNAIVIGLNMDDSILTRSRSLRQALSQAYDIAPLLDSTLKNHFVSAHSPLLPGTEGYEESFRNAYRQPNAENVRELLKKAGFAEGKNLPELTLDYTSKFPHPLLAEKFKADLAEFGVKIRLNALSPTELENSIRQKKSQLFLTEISASSPEAVTPLTAFYGEASGKENVFRYQSKFVDTLYELSLKTSTSAKRVEFIQKIRDQIVSDAPCIFVVHSVENFWVSPWVKEFKPSAFSKGFLRDLTIQFDERNQRKSKL